MNKHVGEVVWPNFVVDSIAVCIAYTVFTLTVRAALEHIANNFLSDAYAVVLQIAIAGLDILRAVLGLSAADAQALRCGRPALLLCLSLRSDTLLFIILGSIADLESILELSLCSVIQSILFLFDLNDCLKILVLGNNAILVGACKWTSHILIHLDARRLDLTVYIIRTIDRLALHLWLL